MSLNSKAISKKFSSKNILFVSHDASQTGAPIVFLNFISWYKINSENNFDIYLKEGGDLKDEFSKLAKTYLVNESSKNNDLIKRAIRRITNKKQTHKLPKKLTDNKYDLIFINTVASLEIVELLASTFKCPIICNVHENDFTINRFFLNHIHARNLNLVNHFIAVSKSTKLNLIENIGINPQKISLIYETINFEKINQITISDKEIKKELKIENEFIVGCSGLATWRKGVDLFIQIAAYLYKNSENYKIKFVWVGQNQTDFTNEINYELKKIGLKKDIIFTGTKVNPQNYFQIFDVFCLSSREDPFPLVVLEAAALGKPILCFDKAGGIPELLEGVNGGYCVPYADVEEMAKKIIYLYNNRELTEQMGKTMAKAILNYDVNIIGKQISNLIDEFVF